MTVVSGLLRDVGYEAAYFARELVRREYHLGAIIANRVLPISMTAKASATSARKLVKAADGDLADQIAEQLDAPPGVVTDVLTEVGTRFHDVAVVATREAERRAELADLCHLLVAVPVLDRDVNDVADLLELAAHFTS